MKLYFPVVKNQNLIDKLALAGYELTADIAEADNYIPGIVRFSNRLNSYLKENKPAKAAELKLELATKSGLLDAIVAANLNVVKTVKEASLENIQNFGGAFIIKPSSGLSANDPYTFTYKLFNSYAEFLSYIDLETFNSNFIANDVYKNYIIQQSLADANGEITQIFVSGFINSNSEVYIECHHTVKMEQDLRHDNLGQGISAYPSSFLRKTDSYSDPTNIIDTYEVLAQIDSLFAINQVKNIPFQVQALVDPNDSSIAYITDLGYKMRPQNYALGINDDYIIDKLNFMFKDEPALIPNTIYTYYANLDISKGITTELENYCELNKIYVDFAFGAKENRRNIPFIITGNSKEEIDVSLQNLKDFILTY